jgi:hypothetical protein
MPIIHITLHVQIAGNLDSPVVAELQGATALMDEPELTGWSVGRRLACRKGPSDNDPLFHVAFLGNQHNLVTRARRADHAPAISDPLR